MDLTIRDFQPINNWYVDLEGEKFDSGEHKGTPKYIVDATTEKKYLNDSISNIRYKCIWLTLGTPFVHIPAGALNVAYRVAKIAFLFHFCMSFEEGTLYDLSCGRIQDGIRIIAQPFSIIGLEFAAIYGVYNPYDGRKLYASIENAQYGKGILAPCFQPST